MHGIAEALGMEPLKVKHDLVSIDDDELDEELEQDEENRVDPRLEADFEQARKAIKTATEAGSMAISNLGVIAASGEDPKAYAALSEMIRAVSAAQTTLLDLHQRRKKVKDVPMPKGKAVETPAPSEGATPTTQINNVFVGSADDLDKYIGVSR